MYTVDVIIPTYKPDEKLFKIIDILEAQTYAVRNIIIINTEQKYWDSLMYGRKDISRFKNLNVRHISAREFDHGGTRRMAAGLSDADYFCMMTQDALPADELLVEKLMAAFEQDDRVAVAYARQLPNPDASPTESYIRSFNYPENSGVKTWDDRDRLGIKTFFCSNVCAMYKKSIYLEMGGFIRKTIFNEDMIYAGNAVRKGYSVAYAADARVYHSHNYSGSQQLHRNFDLAVSQAQHPEIFDGFRSEGEGLKLVKNMWAYLKTIGQKRLMPGFIYNCACRYAGFSLGRRYKSLSRRMILKLTSNKYYWY